MSFSETSSEFIRVVTIFMLKTEIRRDVVTGSSSLHLLRFQHAIPCRHGSQFQKASGYSRQPTPARKISQASSSFLSYFLRFYAPDFHPTSFSIRNALTISISFLLLSTVRENVILLSFCLLLSLQRILYIIN